MGDVNSIPGTLIGLDLVTPSGGETARSAVLEAQRFVLANSAAPPANGSRCARDGWVSRIALAHPPPALIGGLATTHGWYTVCVCCRYYIENTTEAGLVFDSHFVDAAVTVTQSSTQAAAPKLQYEV